MFFERGALSARARLRRRRAPGWPGATRGGPACERADGSDGRAAADAFDFGARLAVLETMVTQGWVAVSGSDSAGWQGQ